MDPRTTEQLSPSTLADSEPHPSQTIALEHFGRRRTNALWLIPCVALAIIALAFAAEAFPQAPYSATPQAKPSPYGPYLQPVPQAPVGDPQYAQPAPQPYASQPQVQAPQYQQPQYVQPAQQPYADQPQYAPQYQVPQYQQPEYAPQPYADQQPQYAPQQPGAPQNYADEQPYDQQAPGYSERSQPPAQALSAEDLEQLLAPIALYPDSLLAQILAASTYPAQVAVADQWLGQMRAAGYGSPDQIAAGANAQTDWDPSVKALTAFPDVLDMLNQNLEWTTNLGNAYYNQPQDVMQTVQVLRQRAEQAGNLQSTPQEQVQDDQGYIDLTPTNPEEVYVPTYNPWSVYGTPIEPCPGFSFFGALGDFVDGLPIQYGLSFALGAFDRMPFGWLAWGLDWMGHGILFDHGGYYTHSRTVADWGLPHGGPRAWGRGGAWGGSGNRNWGGREGGYQNGGRGYDRGGNNQRGGWPGNSGERGGWQNNSGGRGGAGSYVRPAQGFPEPGRLDYSNRMSPQRNNSYTRPTMPAPQMYNRMPQRYSNPGYNNGYNGRSNYGYNGPQDYSTRPAYRYSSPTPAYRFTQPGYSRAYSQPGPSRAYENYNNMARSDHSGGFHLFGGGASRSYSQRAPSYSYKAPKNFGGGHMNFGGGHMNFGGGHASSGGGHMSAPHMSHFGGGGGGGGKHHR